jgi:U3 small nucleolar RNA-associated protein 20
MWKYLDVLLSLPHTIPADLIESLGLLLQKILPMERSVTLTPLIGKALSIYSRGKGTKTKSLVENTCKAFPKLGDNMTFLQGVVDFALVSTFKEFIDEEYIKEMVTKLITNLLLPSHEVRTSSLRCLEILYAYKNPTSQVSEIINTAKLIEDTPLAINNARTISMYIRRLGIEYPSVPKDSWARRIVPYYCFGLLTLHFAPAWDDSALVLAKVAEIEEELVAQLAFSWLSLKSEGEDTKPEAHVASNPWTSYECSNMRVVEEDSKRCMTENIDASIILASAFEKVRFIQCYF